LSCDAGVIGSRVTQQLRTLKLDRIATSTHEVHEGHEEHEEKLAFFLHVLHRLHGLHVCFLIPRLRTRFTEAESPTWG
jgi:hypothetical protein